MVGFAVIVFVLGLFVGGCGGNGEADAKASAQRFVSAMERGDNLGMRETMTALAKRRMADFPTFAEKIAGDSSSEASATYGKPVIENEYARVPLILQEASDTQNAVVRLRFEEARWRVYALDLTGSTSGSPLMTIDFENPEATIGSAFRGLGQAMGAFASEMGKGLGAFARGMKEGAASARGGSVLSSPDAKESKSPLSTESHSADKAGKAIGQMLQGGFETAARNAEQVAEQGAREAQRAAEKGLREAENNAEPALRAPENSGANLAGGSGVTIADNSSSVSEVRNPDGSSIKTTTTRKGNETTKIVVTRGENGTVTTTTTTTKTGKL